jgi:predicted nucleic-acid-binding protein
MIGLDTNIVVRYIVQDDPVQSQKANEIIEQRLTQRNLGYVSIIALVETVWVLERAYRFTDIEIASAVEGLLQTDILVIENEQEVFLAMTALKEGWGSFSDALLAGLGAKAGCTHTLTFDKKAPRLPGFVSA